MDAEHCFPAWENLPKVYGKISFKKYVSLSVIHINYQNDIVVLEKVINGVSNGKIH